jgi:hypothetical protein
MDDFPKIGYFKKIKKARNDPKIISLPKIS